MKMNRGIFDLGTMDDLSPAVRKELNCDKLNDNDHLILELFDFKDEISIDEIIVGLYRNFKFTVRSRKWVRSRLFALEAKKRIKSDGKKQGIYIRTSILNKNRNKKEIL